MTKRVLCLLISALMALMALPAMAMEGDGSVAAPETLSEGFDYCFPDGDRLLVSGEDGLYVWRPGDAEAKRLSYAMPELEENETDVIYPFADGGQLYAIRLVTEDDEGELDFGDTALYALTEAGDTLEAEELDGLKWDDLLYFDEDDNPFARRPRQVIAADGIAWLVCNNHNNETQATTLARLDIEDCDLEVLDELENILAVEPYKDGRVLLLQGDEYGFATTILDYDPNEEEVVNTIIPEIDYLSTFVGMGYDAEKDILYVAHNGELCPVDLEGSKLKSSVAAIPVLDFRPVSACVINGIYMACDGSINSRALYGRPEVTVRLRVNDCAGWADSIEEAIKRFNATHDEARVSLTRDTGVQAGIVEAMMRQDSSVDIFVLDTSMPTYEAVFDRGFLMPLDGSPAVKALVDEMYPGVRESITREGKIQALPANVSSYGLAVSEKALAKLGLTLADLPDTWDGFLDFLPTLAGPLSEHPEMRLMNGVYSIQDARLGLLALLVVDYINYVAAEKLDVGFNAEPATSLANKISALPFESLGVDASADGLSDTALSPVPDDEGIYIFNYIASRMIGNFCYPEYTPLLLRLTPDAPCYLSLECSMAAVNPFTEHPEEALEFMGLVTECLRPSSRAGLVPTINEPVRGAAHERELAKARETVAGLEVQAERASSANRQLVEAELNKAKDTLEKLEQTAWDISPEALEWYRAHDDHLIVSGVNWLNTDYAQDNYNLLLQFCAGELSGGELLADFDKTSEMIRKEGN